MSQNEDIYLEVQPIRASIEAASPGGAARPAAV